MRAHLLAGALLLAPALASASPYPQANLYFEVRDRAQVVEQFTPEEVQAQPERFAGRLLEVRGQVTALVGSEAQTTLLVERAGGAGSVMISLPPDKKPADFPFIDIGTSLRALCHVVTVPGTTAGALELRVAVKEFEAAQVDAARAKAAAAAAKKAAALRQQKSPPRALASRGGGSGAVRQAWVRLSREEVIRRYADAVRYFNRRISPAVARNIARTIIDYSLKYGLDARLVMAVIAVESNFNPDAVSPAGAQGLGQLMPGTAADLGVADAFDPEQNLEGSTRLLSRHIRNMTADGRPTEEALKLALACYNAGAGAVRKYKGIPPYRETQAYVRKVTRLYRQLCGVATP